MRLRCCIIASLAAFATPLGHRHRRHEPMNTALASYYIYPPTARTACGYSAPVGVANRSLPCGTRVLFCMARCAIAIVDDRGPYIYSRLWDLTVSLGRAIGFPFGAGVAPVRWRLVR